MVALMYEKKMLLLILVMVYIGLQQAFIYLVLFHYSLLIGIFIYELVHSFVINPG